MTSRSVGSAERVGAAWAMGHLAEASHIETDGKSVWSWGRHVVASTSPEGLKIANCCHYSQSTAVHSSAVRPFADQVVECDKCGRPDLHKTSGLPQDQEHFKRPVLLDKCREDWFRKPTQALRAHPDAACAFVCLFCRVWHVNDSWTTDPRESANEHQADESVDSMWSHRLNPGKPEVDVLYQRYGFESESDYQAISRDLHVLYTSPGDWNRYLGWKLLDRTKDGLVKAFPRILEPQPAYRLWYVRPYAGRTWHRSMGSNPITSRSNSKPALCGAPPSKTDHGGNYSFWGEHRITPPDKARVCQPCEELSERTEIKVAA